MKKEGRSVQFHFYVSEQEAAAIQERMEQIGVEIGRASCRERV